MSIKSVINNYFRYPVLYLAAGAILFSGACSKPAITAPTPTANPTHIVTSAPTPTLENRVTPTPEATAKPKSAYDLALEKLDYQTAQHWIGIVRDYNSEQAINELVFLP